MSIQPGSAAPPFDLPTDTDERVSLAGLSGRAAVLYFYPRDDTPGCTTEAQGFSALAADFAQAGAVVIGVSKDSVRRHASFRRKYDLDVILGSDTDGAVVEAYGVWVQKVLHGRQYMGIERATFLIDGKGLVRQVWRKVKVAGHAETVLAAVKALD